LNLHIELSDIDATESFARKLAEAIDRPITIALNGTLGAGKTQLARFLCGSLGVPAESVTSPTYVLLQRYRGEHFEIYHFDFYRLDNAHQVWDLGFDELQESGAILLVEWAEKFPETLPVDHLTVHLSVPNSEEPVHERPNRRDVDVSSSGPNSAQVVQRLGEFGSRTSRP
jgi:tRNA threonylcarbamoyladenosine biosynthesis protein TsaE